MVAVLSFNKVMTRLSFDKSLAIVPFPNVRALHRNCALRKSSNAPVNISGLFFTTIDPLSGESICTNKNGSSRVSCGFQFGLEAHNKAIRPITDAISVRVFNEISTWHKCRR